MSCNQNFPETHVLKVLNDFVQNGSAHRKDSVIGMSCYWVKGNTCGPTRQ